MSKLKIILVSKYPRLDVLDWKKTLVDKVLESDFSLSIVYSCTDLRSYIKEGIRRYETDFLSELLKIIRGKFRRHGTSSNVYGKQLLSEYAKQRNILVYSVKEINSRESLELISKISPDIAILSGSEIIRKSFLDIPKIGTINPHFAILPKYRGMSTIEWSIFHGDEVGISVHFVEPRIDMGDILNQDTVSIEKGDTPQDIREKIRYRSVDLLIRTCLELREGRISPIKQKPEDGKQFFKIHPELKKIAEGKLHQYYD